MRRPFHSPEPGSRGASFGYNHPMHSSMACSGRASVPNINAAPAPVTVIPFTVHSRRQNPLSGDNRRFGVLAQVVLGGVFCRTPTPGSDLVLFRAPWPLFSSSLTFRASCSRSSCGAPVGPRRPADRQYRACGRSSPAMRSGPRRGAIHVRCRRPPRLLPRSSRPEKATWRTHGSSSLIFPPYSASQQVARPAGRIEGSAVQRHCSRSRRTLRPTGSGRRPARAHGRRRPLPTASAG